MTRPDEPDIQRLIALAREAGELALGHFRQGQQTTARIWSKAGGSPVTEADIAVDRFLAEGCRALLPEAAWLSEETADAPERLGRDLVWVVDPIDGTRAFMAGLPDWSVCVALLSGDAPVLGVVHAPALGVTYSGVAGGGAARNGAGMTTSGASDLSDARIAGPQPLVQALARHADIASQPKIPSLALRIARIAEGSLDGGLVSPDSRDWDLAAADLILSEAGGRLTRADGSPLVYNRPRPVHPTLIGSNGRIHDELVAAAGLIRAEFRR